MILTVLTLKELLTQALARAEQRSVELASIEMPFAHAKSAIGGDLSCNTNASRDSKIQKTNGSYWNKARSLGAVNMKM